MHPDRPWLKNYPQGVPAEIDPDEYRSISAVFAASVSRYGDRPAYRNMGKTLTYANVVRGMVRVGEWTGKETTVTAPLSATQAPEADGYVVVVQAERPGKHGLMMPGAILGAARGLTKR